MISGFFMQFPRLSCEIITPVLMFFDISKTKEEVIKNIKRDMDAIKKKLRKECKFYSKDLLECIFSKPYTTIDDVVKTTDKQRLTAGKYLDKLVELKILEIDKKQGSESKYYNTHLIWILKNSLK